MHSTEDVWAVLGHWEKWSPFSLTVWPMTGCLAAVGGALHPELLFSFVQSVTFIFPLSLISSFSSLFGGHALILYRRVRLSNEVWIRHVRLVTRLWERGLQMVITDNCDLTMMLMVQTVWL